MWQEDSGIIDLMECLLREVAKNPQCREWTMMDVEDDNDKEARKALRRLGRGAKYREQTEKAVAYIGQMENRHDRDLAEQLFECMAERERVIVALLADEKLS